VLVAVVLVVAVGAGAVWTVYGAQIADKLGWVQPDDYEGAGNGTEVDVTITAGDIGSDVAQTLVDSGVTASFDVFYELLLEREEEAVFIPGSYRLQQRMSAQAALDALLDPANRLVSTVAVREGITLPTIVELLSAGTGIPEADFEAVLDGDPAEFGVPADAPGFEGWLFPATYQFDPGVDARGIVQTMIDRMIESLDGFGVPPEDRLEVVTIASLLQREARMADDFYKVSRVIQNRLEAGMRLQFDSTAHYGAGRTGGSVWSDADELNDDNPYNTYVIDGLPIGPISAPGDHALDAALHPADGDWLFFVTVDLRTGETVFTRTADQHAAAVEQLRAWCRQPGNADYCD